MKELLLTRLVDNGMQTTGYMTMFEGFRDIAYFTTLELPFKNNQKNISCIPSGTYDCSVRYSDKYGRHLIVEGVEDRSLILLHYGNYNSNTKGCILVGEKHTKINKDDLFDISNSKASLRKLMSYIKDDEIIQLTIVSAVL